MAYIGTSPSNGVRRVHTYTATANQTTFTGSSTEGVTLTYADTNYIDVFQNGVLLGSADYTSTSGTSVVLAQGASVSDLVVIVVYDVFSVADTVSKTSGGSFDSGVTMSSTLAVTGASTLTGALSAKGGAVFNEDSADVDFRVESNGNANMLFVDGGNDAVGIGTSSALSGSSSATTLRIGNQISIYELDDSSNPVQLNINQNIDSSENYIVTDHAARYQMRDGVHKWFSVGSGSAGAATSISGAEKMQLDANGNLLVGTTTAVAKFNVVGNNFGISGETTAGGNAGVAIASKRTSNGIQMRFYQGTTVCGDITTNGSAVSYGSNSDHRLKENVVTNWDATTRLKQLNPVRFNFIADADTTVDGFLAHEVQSVVPEAITGTHNEVDDDGNAVYQGIDQSKLVPLLVKTIQELEARITALESA